MQQMHGLDQLRGQGRMGWIEEEKGWVAAPEDVVGALANDGLAECKREMTTSRRGHLGESPGVASGDRVHHDRRRDPHGRFRAGRGARCVPRGRRGELIHERATRDDGFLV